MKIASVSRVLPDNYFDQDTLIAALREHWESMGRKRGLDRLESLHRKVSVGGRHLALPLEGYKQIKNWDDANNAWIQCAEKLGTRAVEQILQNTGLKPDQIGALFFVSVTGIATPSIDARIMNRLQLPESIKRIPIFGLGCVAGAAGISRAVDYVKAYPDQVALLVSVELCSLTLQNSDESVANLIASGLFGDGCAAVLVAGERTSYAGPRVEATRSVFYRDTERLMGWDIGEKGFRVILSPEVPQVVNDYLRKNVDEFLGEHDLTRKDIDHWICHPGGPKVIQALLNALELPDEALAVTWKSLQGVGNLSSASVLFVLAETLGLDPEPGSTGLLMAMGPGFCSELVLLRWP